MGFFLGFKIYIKTLGFMSEEHLRISCFGSYLSRLSGGLVDKWAPLRGRLSRPVKPAPAEDTMM